MLTTIKASIKSGDFAGKSAECTYNFGDSLEDAAARFTEEVVFNNFRAQAIVSAQGIIRSALKAGRDPQEALDAWLPGVVNRAKKSRLDKAREAIKGLTPEQIAEILADAAEVDDDSDDEGYDED